MESFRDRAIFTREIPGSADGPAFLFLHGYPSSSYDFRGLIGELGDAPALFFDFLGFGLSAKPPSAPGSRGRTRAG